MRALGVLSLLLFAFGVTAQSGNHALTLADVLSRAPEKIGPAPAKYTTPFLVVSVVPIESGECTLQLATNGMLYTAYAYIDAGRCQHLPALHALVWGRAWHSRAAEILREADVLDAESELIDIVYSSGPKPKAVTYFIGSAEVIDANWGLSPAPQAEANSNTGLVAQIKANSEAGKSSDASAASGHNDTPAQMADLIKNGQASRCLVTTNPAGAEIDIDGKQAGKTPMAFILYRHPDADRVITIKLAGYNTIEKKASPDGHDITMNLTLEPEQVR